MWQMMCQYLQALMHQAHQPKLQLQLQLQLQMLQQQELFCQQIPDSTYHWTQQCQTHRLRWLPQLG